MDNRCVCCGAIIPEGRQVCPKCEKGNQMKQIISKDGVIVCVTSIPYSAAIIKDMKKAGYKIKVEDT